MNYYAIKKGRNPGIYLTWDQARKEVIGFSGAVYKKFNNEDEAKKFIEGINSDINEVESLDIKDGELISYVDGSYRSKDSSFSYGAVLFDNKGLYETHSKRFYKEDSTMRNVSGEIKGAMYAMQRAIELGKKKLYIHYDYAGIENWALGNWKANKEGTKEYRDFYSSINDKLEVVFIKVKAHSGVKYNEIVDKLAKEAK
ncbi:MAG: ribonuclease H1 domain-containing protein [Peptoniphilaceae bacterium]